MRGTCYKGSRRAPECYGVFWQGGHLAQQKRSIFHPLNHILGILFLVAVFSLRASLLHLSKCIRHVLDLIPNIKTYVDRCALLSRHRYTIAGPSIYVDDLLLLQFVLSAEDKSRKIGAPLEIVDDHAFDTCSRRSQDDR